MAYYYTDELYFQRKMNRELSIEKLTEGKKNNGEDKGEEIIHFLMCNQKNRKKPKKQIISESDLSRQDFLGQILREYNELLEQIRKDLKEKQGDDKRFLRTRAISQIKQDMQYTKDALDGVFGYHVHSLESNVPNLDAIDLQNPAHVKALIRIRLEFDPNNDLSFIILDLEEIIQKVLNEEDMLIVEMLRDELQIKEIAHILGLTYKQTQYRIRKIVKKIADY